MSEQPSALTQETSQKPSGQLVRHHIYLKSSSFEILSQLPFLLNAPPLLSHELGIDVNIIAHEQNLYTALLALKMAAKSHQEIIWQAKVEQAGIYALKDISDDFEKMRILNGFCINQLYPYATTAINQLAILGGFPPASFKQINFEELYLEKNESAPEIEKSAQMRG